LSYKSAHPKQLCPLLVTQFSYLELVENNGISSSFEGLCLFL
jgi:hypothetical protein